MLAHTIVANALALVSHRLHECEPSAGLCNVQRTEADENPLFWRLFSLQPSVERAPRGPVLTRLQMETGADAYSVEQITELIENLRSAEVEVRSSSSPTNPPECLSDAARSHRSAASHCPCPRARPHSRRAPSLPCWSVSSWCMRCTVPLRPCCLLLDRIISNHLRKMARCSSHIPDTIDDEDEVLTALAEEVCALILKLILTFGSLRNLCR